MAKEQKNKNPAENGKNTEAFDRSMLDSYAHFVVGAANEKIRPYAVLNGLTSMIPDPDADAVISSIVDVYLEATPFIKQYEEAVKKGETPQATIPRSMAKAYNQVNTATKIFSQKFVDAYNGLTVAQALEYNTENGKTILPIGEKTKKLLDDKKSVNVSQLKDDDPVKIALMNLTNTKIGTRFDSAAKEREGSMNMSRLEESLA